jgi:hypothetical protein
MAIACCTCATGKWWTAFPFINMSAIWRGFVRTILWSYERGSWPYDIAVVVIVIFVLATPARWFHDQPQTRAAAVASVQQISEDSYAGTTVYHVDATVLAPDKRTNRSTPELERELHRILASSIGELKDQPFEVTQITPRMAPDGSVASYDVVVKR